MLPPTTSLLLLSLLLLLLLTPTVSQCHNLCSGNGVCSANSICICNANHHGPDCSVKLCPSGNAWGAVPDATGNAHYLQECSARGHCDSGTGLCQCDPLFTGGACEQLKCANNCTDHGQCMTMKDAASEFNGYSLNRSVTYNLWDAEQIYGCVCDYGYGGYDCSQRTCEKGDDPRTSIGNYEVVSLYCECAATCSGNVVLRHKLNTLKLAHDASATDVANGLMNLPNSKHESAVFTAGSPVTAVMSGAATLCSTAGTTTAITFSGETGALPSIDVQSNQLASTATTPTIYFETVQTLTCVMTGAASGSFALELDGVTTDDIAFDASAATIQTQLTTMYSKVNAAAAITAVVTFGAGAAPCADASTVVTTMKLRTASGNLPSLGVIGSLIDATVNAPTALTLSFAARGSKDSKVCSGIGTCNSENGKCDCGYYYSFADQYGGACSAPVINTSSWTGVETCPGVVYQSDLSLPVPKPSSLPRLYFTQASNISNTGLHYYLTGGETDAVPSPMLNMTNASVGALALDLAEGFVYYVDRGYKRIERASLYNNTKTHVSGTTFKHGQNTHPYSGETIHYVTPFTSVQTTTPYGLALDLRWNSRYLYFTVPGVAGTADGTVKRCALDVAGGIWNLCTEEDLSTVIEAALGSQINTPRGIALDLVHLKLYWVDSGAETVADGAVYTSNLDGSSASKFMIQNLTDPYSIALDLVNAHMYIGEMYEETTGAGAIGRAKLLGNSSSAPLKWIVRSVLVASNTYIRVNNPEYIALDLDMDRIIFTDTFHEKVLYAHRVNYKDIKGNTGIITGAHTVKDPRGIAFDHGHGYPDASTKFYECFGHGTCLGFAENYRCSCDDGWYGNCNMTTCPTGNAWFDEANSENSAHRPVECSNMGACNRMTGECNCEPGFTGGACERLDCPSGEVGDDSILAECFGMGRCVTLETLARNRIDKHGEPSPLAYSYHMQTNKSSHQLWDSKMIGSCMCDVYWYEGGVWTQNMSDPVGYDCSRLTCPVGDNPSRPANNVTNTDAYEKQALTCTGTSGTFRLSFKGDKSPALAWDIGAISFNTALKNMRTLGNFTMAYTTGQTAFCTAGGTNPVSLEFFSELGDLPSIVADVGGLNGGNSGLAVVEIMKGSKQVLECGGQGICNDMTGECACFKGYSSSDGSGNAGLRGDCGNFGLFYV